MARKDTKELTVREDMPKEDIQLERFDRDSGGQPAPDVPVHPEPARPGPVEPEAPVPAPHTDPDQLGDKAFGVVRMPPQE